MPAEVYLVSREPMTLALVVRAAAEVDDQLVPRRLYENGPVQLVDRHDVAVLTVDSSRPLAGAVGLEIARGIGRLLHARIQVEDCRD